MFDRLKHWLHKDDPPRSNQRAKPKRPSTPPAAKNHHEERRWSHFPIPVNGVGNLDAPRFAGSDLDAAESDLVARVERRVMISELELPRLPTTMMRLIEIASDPGAEVEAMVEILGSDPTLMSELLRTANSVSYGGVAEIETIDEAIMRLGFRKLRNLVYVLSMQSVLFNDRVLEEYAKEVWRQCRAVAAVARAIAADVGLDPERAFALGLLHDIGKIAILSTLQKELHDDHVVRPRLLGKLFNLCHETAGRRMAEEWNLPIEVVSIAGQHHHFEDSPHPESAALVSLAHRLELNLSLGDATGYRWLISSPEMAFFGLDRDARQRVLEHAFAAHVEAEPAHA